MILTILIDHPPNLINPMTTNHPPSPTSLMVIGGSKHTQENSWGPMTACVGNNQKGGKNLTWWNGSPVIIMIVFEEINLVRGRMCTQENSQETMTVCGGRIQNGRGSPTHRDNSLAAMIACFDQNLRGETIACSVTHSIDHMVKSIKYKLINAGSKIFYAN